jgi:putative membrane protein
VAVLTAGVGVLAAPSALAAGGVSAQDTAWAKSNAQTDLAEIAIGKLAAARAEHGATKMLANVTTKDHVKALAELKKVATKAGITLPTAPNATQKAQAAQLKTVPRSQFDATYDADQVKGHELSISQTRTELANGSSSTVMNFAKVYLPVAEMHLKMAETDDSALAGTTGGAPSVNAGTGGMAATHPADDAPWLALSAAGALMLAAAGFVGLRRRYTAR